MCQSVICTELKYEDTHFSAHSSDLTLAHHVEGHNIRKRTSLHVFHDHPEIASHQERVHEVDDVLVLAVLHDQNLVDDQILLRLLLQVHLLDGHTFVRANFKSCVDTTRRTLADLH